MIPLHQNTRAFRSIFIKHNQAYKSFDLIKEMFITRNLIKKCIMNAF